MKGNEININVHLNKNRRKVLTGCIHALHSLEICIEGYNELGDGKTGDMEDKASACFEPLLLFSLSGL